MVDTGRQPNDDAAIVSAEALQKAEEFVEQEEGPLNKLGGKLGTFVTAVAVIMSLFHLYAAYGIMPTHVLRGIHVAFVLFLCFLLYPVARRFRHRVRWWDWLASFAALVVIGYMLVGGDDFLERAIAPNRWDEAVRHRADRAGAGGSAPHGRLDHAGDLYRFPRLRDGRPLAAARRGRTTAWT